MADTDDGEKIDAPQDTKNAASVKIHFDKIELLDKNNPYNINPDVLDLGIPIFKLPISPYIRRNNDGIIPCLPSRALDSFFQQTQFTMNDFNRNLLTINQDFRKMASGLSLKEYNDRIANTGFGTIKFINKTDNKLTDTFSTGVTYALVIPMPDTPPVISKIEHENRNYYQQRFAPRWLETMEVLEKCSFFYLYNKTEPKGFTSTHNLTENTQGERSDAVFLFLTFYCTRIKNNLDYRGLNCKYGDKFKNMQFVYNKNSGQLVVDVINKGTYDFASPDDDGVKHYQNDIYPWIYWGNLIADDENIYMDQNKEERIKGIGQKYINEKKITDENIIKEIYDLFPEKKRPKT